MSNEYELKLISELCSIAINPKIDEKDRKRVEEITQELSKTENKRAVKGAICRKMGIDLGKYKTTASIENIASSLVYLNELGIDVKKAVNRLPQLLGYSVEYMDERVKYLESLGMDVAKAVNRSPQLLALSFEYMDERVKYLESLGMDVKKAVNRSPQLLELSVEKNLKSKVEYLTEEVGISIEKIESTPSLLSLSLEKRIKPRWEYIKKLGKDYISEAQKVRCLLYKEEDFHDYLEKI